MRDAMKRSRRRFLGTAAAVAASLSFASLPFAALAADDGKPPMKIGVIGSGRIGGTLGELWAKAGYQVMFSSLDLAKDKELAERVGNGAKAGTPAEAAAFGEVLLISVPYSALPQIGRDYASSIKGKVVLDTSNPIPGRDGDMAVAARDKGSGIASTELLPGARLVRAFNSVGSNSLRSASRRSQGRDPARRRRPRRAQGRGDPGQGGGLRARARWTARQSQELRSGHARVRQGAHRQRVAQDSRPGVVRKS